MKLEMAMNNLKRYESAEQEDAQRSLMTDQERKKALLDDLDALKRKLREVEDSLQKSHAEAQSLEKERAEFQRGGQSGNKEKIFQDKLKKITNEVNSIESQLKDMN